MAEEPKTPFQLIWEEYFTKVCAVSARTTTSAAASRGITPAEAKIEADRIYPKLRAERDAALKRLGNV